MKSLDPFCPSALLPQLTLAPLFSEANLHINRRALSSTLLSFKCLMPSSSLTKPCGIKKHQTRNVAPTIYKNQYRTAPVKSEPTCSSPLPSKSTKSPVVELHPWVTYVSSSSGDWVHYEPDQDFQHQYNPQQYAQQSATQYSHCTDLSSATSPSSQQTACPQVDATVDITTSPPAVYGHIQSASPKQFSSGRTRDAPIGKPPDLRGPGFSS